MKKTLSALIILSVFFSISSIIPSVYAAENKSYFQLYNQYLRNLDKKTNSKRSDASQLHGAAPAKGVDIQALPESPTKGQISVVGRIYRNSKGGYFIRQESGPGRFIRKNLRVYGRSLSREIVAAVVFDRVQLLGKPAYSRKNLVGVSVQKIVVLSQRAREYKRTPLIRRTRTIQTFSGNIVIDKSRAYLVIDKARRMLLNRADWRKAWTNAYKGKVKVEGYLTKGGGIRYTDIIR